MMRNYFYLMAVVILLFVGVVEGQVEWGQFRGPGGAGVAADEGKLPVEFGRTSNLIWQCVVPKGLSSPCICGDRIFLTGYAARKLETICIDRATGEILWRREAPVEKIERVHSVNHQASPTPATDGERVYVYFGSYGLLCYDFEGNELWRAKQPEPRSTYGTAASPIVVGDKLIFNNDQNDSSFLLVLDSKTGDTVWKKERTGFRSGWSTPVYWQRGGVDEVIVNGAFRMISYNLKDGAELWSVGGLTDEACITPVMNEGMLYVTSYNMGRSPEVQGLPTYGELLKLHDANEDKLLGIDELPRNLIFLGRIGAEGEGDIMLRSFLRRMDADKDEKLTLEEWGYLQEYLDVWDFENGLMAFRPGTKERETEMVWHHLSGAPEVPSPLYYEGLVYIVTNGGLVTCVDARTGELKYRAKVGASGAYYSSPVAGDGKVYVVSTRGVVSVVAAGEVFELLGQNELKERTSATPALVEGVVYIRTDKSLYAFGSRMDF
ncbi:MAG: PQQ-binding-like beta-propeller repeat protein [Planctomycetes bacterium]|nr:PQQ-binding-like beta-propeller repeat protein [Planctomycetota bacterium]